MGLASALSTALTGLKAAETVIDVAGNNVANSNTVGFKASEAVFASQLERNGQWELQYYLPRKPSRRSWMDRERGTWNIIVEDESGTQTVPFDADDGDPGWNLLGTFEIAAGEVRVRVSQETEGKFVLADAVRWVPVTTGAGAVASR